MLARQVLGAESAWALAAMLRAQERPAPHSAPLSDRVGA